MPYDCVWIERVIWVGGFKPLLVAFNSRDIFPHIKVKLSSGDTRTQADNFLCKTIDFVRFKIEAIKEVLCYF